MELTHFDKNGNAVMVDVTEKAITNRTAVAVGSIQVCREIFERIKSGSIAKGDVLQTARIAGITGAKKTSSLIPLCHPIGLDKCIVDFKLEESSCTIQAVCTAKTSSKTGVEMEALTGVSTALLTIYDMCKAVDKSMVISDIHLLEKTGGKSGDFRFVETSSQANALPVKKSQPFSESGIVRAVCISEKKGTEKKPVHSVELLEDFGIKGDAHAGKWHRQVSLLSADKIREFNEKGGDAHEGAFGENIIVEGIDLRRLPVGSRLSCSGCLLEVSQIGKECHSHCQIYHRVGDCIMPREGIFAVVKKGGTISAGDVMTALSPSPDRPLTAAVITLSDKGAAGEREDLSGPAAQALLDEAGYDVQENLLLPDEPSLLKHHLIRLSDSRQVNLVVTTGGTGFSLRDQTPEATLEVAHRNVPGIAEAMRAYSMQITGRAMLSRGVCVIRNRTLIVNLPGSPKAVKESLSYILPQLEHGIRILLNLDGECASTESPSLGHR